MAVPVADAVAEEPDAEGLSKETLFGADELDRVTLLDNNTEDADSEELEVDELAKELLP